MNKMKKTKSYLHMLLGLVLLIAGLIMVKTVIDPQGIMLALPYVCIGIGCGIFGQGMGNIISRKTINNNPDIGKKMEIDQNDERNVTIKNKAKAKAYDMMIFVFGALMIAFALMGVNLINILLLVIAYLFVVVYGVYYRCKYDKEM